MNDLISVIIPVKNGHKYLAQALEGIKAQNMNVEIIVVDDASTDDTAEIAESYGAKVIKHEISKGQVAGKNSGLKVAQGKYIMFHDHDDIMREGTLKKLYEAICADDELFMVMGKVKDFISEDAVDKNIQMKPAPYWGLFTGAVLMRKELFERVGLFDETIQAGEIISLQMTMQQVGLKIEKLDFVASDRRLHDSNFGRTAQKKEYKDYAAILRKLRRG
jgi:glycosyltransferase involved in cell wall biosynthesis